MSLDTSPSVIVGIGRVARGHARGTGALGRGRGGRRGPALMALGGFLRRHDEGRERRQWPRHFKEWVLRNQIQNIH